MSNSIYIISYVEKESLFNIAYIKGAAIRAYCPDNMQRGELCVFIPKMSHEYEKNLEIIKKSFGIQEKAFDYFPEQIDGVFLKMSQFIQ